MTLTVALDPPPGTVMRTALPRGASVAMARVQGALGRADAGSGSQRGHGMDTDTRPQPGSAGPGRTHNTATDLRSCWSGAVVCWCWLVAPSGFEPPLPP